MFLELVRTLNTLVPLDHVLAKHRFRKYEELADTFSRIYCLCPPLTGCKILHLVEENNKVLTG
jgi:hypothetical protein